MSNETKANADTGLDLTSLGWVLTDPEDGFNLDSDELVLQKFATVNDFILDAVSTALNRLYEEEEEKRLAAMTPEQRARHRCLLSEQRDSDIPF